MALGGAAILTGGGAVLLAIGRVFVRTELIIKINDNHMAMRHTALRVSTACTVKGRGTDGKRMENGEREEGRR